MDSTHPWAQGFQSYSRPFLCCCVNHLSWTELYQCLFACCRSSLWHNLKEVCDAQKAFTWCKYTRATRRSCFVVTLVATWPCVYILICFSHITPVVSLILLSSCYLSYYSPPRCFIFSVPPYIRLPKFQTNFWKRADNSGEVFIYNCANCRTALIRIHSP